MKRSRSRDVPTSRRPHVVTSQRRDVGSTNVQVNKRQRRDVSTSSAFSALKANGGADLEASGGVQTRHGIPEQQRHRLRSSAHDLYCFSFLDIKMMFLRLNIFIFLFSMF